MTDQNELFSILDSVDSTNNYATGQVHAGLAKHGQAWYAREQFAGKGQRGKSWISTKDENLILSVVIRPDRAFTSNPFLLSALIATICHDFFAGFAGEGTRIKWPNDIYWRDRKAGGILIENIFKGSELTWSVAGIGININQFLFTEETGNATSLRLITKKEFDPLKLARELHALIRDAFEKNRGYIPEEIIGNYNRQLYKKGETVVMKKENAIFRTDVVSVNRFGQLLTKDVMERTFEFGEVQWMF